MADPVENNKWEEHEKRISTLEFELRKLISQPSTLVPTNFSFSNKTKGHNELLEELLKSDYCHSKNGLSFDDILEVFKNNGRPVDQKKLRTLLSMWKLRKKIESTKIEGVFRYFWIENE